MPRNPAVKKNQHNNRHENGLVGPGRRVTRQRSNGHLNGNGKPAPSDEPIPSTTNIDSSPQVASSTNHGTSSGIDTPPSLKKRISESSADSQEHRSESVNGTTVASPKRPEMARFKRRSTQDISAMQIASTILKSCPAGDTVALLIVLLALPSMVLTIVQALFASLTLMPPTNISPVAFLSLFDVFQGSAGSPSLGTMAVVDLLCLGLWIGLWNWAQNFALDLAQIQIAITLGNGNSGKNESVNMLCFVIVLVLHAVRSRGVRRFFVSNMIPANMLSHPRVIDLVQYLPGETDFGNSLGAPSKIKSLFAIHILSQALMAFVRRRVASSQTTSGTKSVKRTDTEAYAGSSHMVESTNGDATGTVATGGAEHQPPLTPGFKDPKDKTVSAKKRRRQANQVRSRQPFWAALASTKVHVFREIEHGQGSRGTNIERHPSTFSQCPDHISITNVEPSSIQFETVPSAQFDDEQDSDHLSLSKPFGVRINGAKWHSVQFELIDEDQCLDRWLGTISGLAPDCTYTCSFGRSGDDQEFASIMVKTPALQDNDIPSSSAPIPPRASLRPSSPTTTLKNSIQTADVKLNEVKARLTRSKKSHKAAVSRVEKEVETLTSRLKSSSDDNKQRQKLSQAERSMRQFEEMTAAIELELDGLQAIPEDELVRFEEKKAVYDDRSTMLDGAQQAFDAAKADAKSKLAEVNNELTAISSRRERLKGRQEKLTEQHNRITEANARGMNEKERKAAESAASETHRKRRESDLMSAIQGLNKELREIHGRIALDCREIDSLERHAYTQREIMLNAGPLTPEGNLPGTNPLQPRAFTFGQPQSTLASSMLAPEAQSSPFLAYAKTLPHQRPRSNTNRSNGAVSAYSTNDFDDADPIPPMLNNFDGTSNERKSSGSSRGQNNGSPAGVIGDNFRSPPRLTQSPGLINHAKW